MLAAPSESHDDEEDGGDQPENEREQEEMQEGRTQCEHPMRKVNTPKDFLARVRKLEGETLDHVFLPVERRSVQLP